MSFCGPLELSRTWFAPGAKHAQFAEWRDARTTARGGWTRPSVSTMAPAGYQRVPTNLSTVQRRVAARNNPVPLAVLLVLASAALGAVLYWWPVLDAG